jgi:YYY domain-containing protein
MKDTLLWLLALECIGIAAFPITFVFFRQLPDRGYSLAKPLGLLLLAYGLWVSASAHVLPNTQLSIILLTLCLVAISIAVLTRHGDEFLTYIQHHWRLVLVIEAIFLAVFLSAAYYCSYVPSIGGGEEPVDLAFLNGILRSKYFPPSDPWLSGHSIPYYYFGHLIVATLTKLTGIPSSITFNLARALVAALIAVGGFGIVYNLVAISSSRGRAILFGLVGVLFLVALSNLEGVFELLATHGIGSHGFYGLLDINGLDGPRSSHAWYPTEYWWWGRAQTLSGPWDSHDFPFAAIILGGIHAEHVVIPFELLAIAVALGLLLSGDPLDHRFLRNHTLRFCLIALLLGSLVVLDTWSFPAFALFVVGAVVIRNYLADGQLRLTTLLRTCAFVLPLLALAVLMFLPLYPHLPAGYGGPRFVEMAFRPGGWPPESTVTRPNHFLLYFLTLLWIPASFAAFCLLRSRDMRPNRRRLLVASLPVLLLLAVWSTGIILRHQPTGFVDELTSRRGAWITFLMAASLLTTVSIVFLGALRGASRNQVQLGLLFALMAAAVGISLILGLEFFWVRVRDVWQNRTPTTFRLSLQAWIFLALAAAYGLYFIVSNWQLRTIPAKLNGALWLTATAVVILAGLVYPVLSTFARTNGFTGHRTLNGLALVERFEPQEYEAIVWLNSSVHGTPVILEAAGPEYGATGRISARTGLPTLLGWPSHEYKFRGSWEPQAGRKEAVERLYLTTDLAEARAIIDQYHVTYVYVGPLERQQYDGPGLSKFASFMDVVFQNQEVTIYKMPKDDLETRTR